MAFRSCRKQFLNSHQTPACCLQQTQTFPAARNVFLSPDLRFVANVNSRMSLRRHDTGSCHFRRTIRRPEQHRPVSQLQRRVVPNKGAAVRRWCPADNAIEQFVARTDPHSANDCRRLVLRVAHYDPFGPRDADGWPRRLPVSRLWSGRLDGSWLWSGRLGGSRVWSGRLGGASLRSRCLRRVLLRMPRRAFLRAPVDAVRVPLVRAHSVSRAPNSRKQPALLRRLYASPRPLFGELRSATSSPRPLLHSLSSTAKAPRTCPQIHESYSYLCSILRH